MNKEETIIKLINRIIPAGACRLNKTFECDSEIIEYGDRKMLFSIDEFSSEDMLSDNDPYTLGWNLAAAGISDILAGGGTPLFYGHSMVVGRNWSDDYLKAFCRGVARVLKKSGASFIGGDLGQGAGWSYTVAVIGRLEGKPLLRSGASLDEPIYISGKIGGGNVDAVLRLYSHSKIFKKLGRLPQNTFRLRMSEAALMRKYASSCIDTSDGLGNALESISKMSKTGYYVENIPYLTSGLAASELLSLPKTLLFLGECGEYELLFTVNKKNETDFLKEAKRRKLKYYRIGEVRKPSTRVLFEDNRTIDLSSLRIRARDYDDLKRYLKDLIDWLRK